MALVSINRLWTSRGGTDTFTRQRTYRETWEAITDSTTDDEEVVAGASAAAMGLPRLGQPHARFPFAVCVEVNAEQTDESPFRWLVSIKYDSNPQLPNSTDPDGKSQDPAGIPENPLLRPATWRLSFERTTEPATHWIPIDKAGTMFTGLNPDRGGIIGAAGRLVGAKSGGYLPIRNSAGLPFDPALQVEVARPVYVITKNIPFLQTSFMMALENAINDRPWRGIPKWCAKITNADASSKFENGASYVELSLHISLKKETWIPEILDAGLYGKTRRPTVDANGNTRPESELWEWTKLRDLIGHEATEPQPLDGNGKRLAPNADPVFLRGLPANYQLQNFAALLNL